MHNVPRETPTCYDLVKLLRLNRLTSTTFDGNLHDLTWIQPVFHKLDHRGKQGFNGAITRFGLNGVITGLQRGPGLTGS